MSLTVTGFQLASEKVVEGSVSLSSSRIEANDDVMTTRLTDGAEACRALRMPVVPITAGSTRSFLGSATSSQLLSLILPCSDFSLILK
jgi:hypothetical protein